MDRKIKVYGKTTPYEITLKSNVHPFAVDEYLMIKDAFNNNPLCRVIKSEVILIENEKAYIATAKIESVVKYPIEINAEAVSPTFENIAPFVMNTEPNDGFVLGEIFGTAVDNIPKSYTGLVAMYNNGNVIEQNAIPFVFNYKKMYESPHIGLFGGSGSGKTVAMKVIIEEFMKRGIPGILFDPHLEMNFAECKTEIPSKYRIDFNHSFEIFNIGQNGFGIDFSDLSTDELLSIMSFSGELSGPMDALLRSLHHKGMTLLELRTLIDDLVMLYNKMDTSFEDLTKEEERLRKTYVSKIPGFSTLVALSWRLGALENLGVFNGNTFGLIDAISNRKVCVMRGSMEQIHIVASHIVEKLYVKRRSFIDAREYSTIDADPFPPFFIGMDEAHLFCPNNTSFSLTKRIMKTIAQEGRKYGVFELFATQRPSLLDETIVAQIASKFIFRLSIKEDIDSIKKETDLNESELRKLPYMNSGECYVSSSIIGRTIFAKIRYGITTSKNAKNPFDEFESMSTLSDVDETVLNLLPFNDLTKLDVIKTVKEKTGKVISVPELNKICDELAGKGLMIVENTFMGKSFLKKS
jgi:DNA helicase HerA-like ATPase